MCWIKYLKIKFYFILISPRLLAMAKTFIVWGIPIVWLMLYRYDPSIEIKYYKALRWLGSRGRIHNTSFSS
jgi:hypothetical protein